MYSQTTRDIEVTVKPFYLDDQSSPDDNHFVWAYRVRIVNKGGRTVQLMRRHWVITDAIGRVQEVKGPGVVGEQQASWSAPMRWRMKTDRPSTSPFPPSRWTALTRNPD
jgi:uncharacterized protein affecting Mg2+/Co2+ transport